MFSNLSPSEDLKADWINTSPKYSNQPDAESSTQSGITTKTYYRCGTNWDEALTKAYRAGLERGHQTAVVLHNDLRLLTDTKPPETKLIRRYRLFVGTCRITMSKKARVLTVQNIADQLFLHALVSVDAELEERVFCTYQNLEQLSCPVGDYIASVDIGACTHHIFDLSVYTNVN